MILLTKIIITKIKLFFIYSPHFTLSDMKDFSNLENRSYNVRQNLQHSNNFSISMGYRNNDIAPFLYTYYLPQTCLYKKIL